MQHQAGGIRQVFLAARQFRLGALHFDGRERPDFHLRLIVFEQLLRQFQGLPFHPHVFVEADQVPIQPHH